MAFVAPIVEGHGETEALPILLRRMAVSAGIAEPLRVNPPLRVKSGSFLTDDVYFHKYVSAAAAKAVQGNGGVLILLDCEDDLPCRLGPKLLAKAQAVRSDVRYLVVLACREFETWFIAAAESLRGQLGLPTDLSPPSFTDNIRDAKGWLGARMTGGYDPVAHQHKLTKLFDLEQARNNTSFKRFCARLPALVES